MTFYAAEKTNLMLLFFPIRCFRLLMLPFPHSAFGGLFLLREISHSASMGLLPSTERKDEAAGPQTPRCSNSQAKNRVYLSKSRTQKSRNTDTT